MSFNLHLEISGLCLLVRRKSELVILLPVTPGGSHKHHPVLGSHKDYQPGWNQGSGLGRLADPYIYHDLGRAPITFATKPHISTPVDTDFSKLGVVDLPCGNGVQPSAAYVEIHLPHGRPDQQGKVLRGACWTQPWALSSPAMQMSTLITWTVDELDNEIDASHAPGLRITVSAPNGTPYDVVLEPSQGMVNMFLFHTLDDEVPWKPTPNETIPPAGNIAPHFHHYHSLLAPGHTCAVPGFYGLAAANGTCVPLPKPDEVISIESEAAGRESHVKRFSDSFGRRYSCVLATTEG